MVLKDALERAVTALAPTQNSARLDAEVLLALVLEKPRHHAYAFPEQSLSATQASCYQALITRRLAGEPIAYLTGEREFWSLSLQVTPATLIPRPETERLVEIALDLIPQGETFRIADLGTGSGAVALAIASERAQCVVVATDCHEPALEVARENAGRHSLSHVDFRVGNWCDALGGESFDLIVSNPPYVRDDDPHLEQGDVRFEPSSALVAGGDGLTAIRTLCQCSVACLEPDGYLLVEHGADQRDSVHDLMLAHGYHPIRHYKDYAGRDRVTQGRLSAQ